MEQESNPAASYQTMLRSVGRHLDEEPSCRITLVEVPDGFLVRLQRTVYRFEPRVELFKREDLLRDATQYVRSERPVPVHQRHQGIWSHFPNGHQDFMRALGYELDQARARHIVIDELEDGVVLTYTRPASTGEGWETSVIVLNLQGIETILNDAFNRRRQVTVPAPPPPRPRNVPPEEPRRRYHRP